MDPQYLAHRVIIILSLLYEQLIKIFNKVKYMSIYSSIIYKKIKLITNKYNSIYMYNLKMILIKFKFQILVECISLNCSRAKQSKSYKYLTPSAIPQLCHCVVCF